MVKGVPYSKLDDAADAESPVLTFASGYMGVVEDREFHLIHRRQRDQLDAWFAGTTSVPVDAFEINGTHLHITDTIRGNLNVEGRSGPEHLGGNTFNAFVAAERILDAHWQWDRLDFFTSSKQAGREVSRYFGLKGNHPSGFPAFHTDASSNVPMRESVVISGPNGDQPHYARITPPNVEAPPLPDAPDVFLSSYSCDRTGEDVWVRVREYFGRRPDGRLYLSPGSIQVEKGIPLDVLKRLHFLSCNREEAERILKHVGVEFHSKNPELLVRAFQDKGVHEVRITDGAYGVYSGLEGGTYYAPPVIPRDHPAILKLVRRFLLNEKESLAFLEDPDFNGCGDARLGSELAARAADLFEEPEQAVLFSSIIGTLQTYNAFSNISNFPDELIFAVVGLANQIFRDPEKFEASGRGSARSES